MTGEDKAREVLATELEECHPDLAQHARNGLDDPEIPMGEAIEAMLIFADMRLDEAVKVARGINRPWSRITADAIEALKDKP